MALNAEKEDKIRAFLINNNPILFLGAGYSYGAKNANDQVLPTGSQLKDMIRERFINVRVSDEDDEYLKTANLRQICEYVKDDLNLYDELQEFIINNLKNVKPRNFDHELLKFSWKKIYTINIDDLIENIYKASNKKLVVQNTSKKKKHNYKDVQLVKIHGCVNQPQEKIIFCDSDYQELINGSLQYRLNDLMMDLESGSFVFIGTSLNEPDIRHYVSIYERAGYHMWRGRIMFIEPKPTIELKRLIKKLHGILIEANAEDFIRCVGRLNYQPEKLEKFRTRLSYSGFHYYQRQMEAQDNEIYESRLYQGAESNWRDLKDRWLFESPDFKSIAEKIDKIDFSASSCFVFSLYGGRLAGKACLLKLLASKLNADGYEVFIFEGRTLSLDDIVDYIKTSPKLVFALLIDDASFYYQDIEKMFQNDFAGKKLIIVTASRLYYHEKKKYYLQGNPYEDYELTDRITLEYARIIYEKLLEKGNIGYLSRKKEDGIRQIFKEKGLIKLLNGLTLGTDFKQRIYGDVKKILCNKSLRKFYLECAIFDAADIAYYPKQLIGGRYAFEYINNGDTTRTIIDEKLVADYVSINSSGLTIRNPLLLDQILRQTKFNEKINVIFDILCYISKRVNEGENSYWRIAFESLTKESWLEEKMKFKRKDILMLYYRLKSYYGRISYYWLQLGITEQRMNDFSKAQIHLTMAREIRPASYQIQHALARNYLKCAVHEKSFEEAKELFEQGTKQMLALVESKEKYKDKAKDYSIHCYINEWIKYLNRWGNKAPVTASVVRKMYKYIEMMKRKDDEYYRDVAMKFVVFLKKHNKTNLINMTPDSVYLKYISELYIDEKNSDEHEDVLVEAI